VADFLSHRAITETEPTSARTETPARGEPSLPVGQAKLARPQSPWRKPWIWVAVLVMIVAGIAYAMLRRTQTGGQTAADTTRAAKVERKDFVRTVRVSGTVEAVESHPIVAPRLAIQAANTLVITKLLTTGTVVHKGDLVAEFDRQSQVRDALDREAEYHDFVEQINKLKATQASDKAVDDTDIKTAEDAVSTAALEVQKNEVISKILGEKNQENLDEANEKLRQLRATYLLKRQSAESALKLLESQRDAKLLAKEHATKNAELLSIHSPADGLVVVNSTFKNSGMADWQEGDQVRAGAAFMQVVNPGAMRVRAPVNQQDLPEIQIGQSAEIYLDAYPDSVFHGKVDRISSVGISDDFSSTVHTFIVMFSIDGSDPKLLPDLSAAADVELQRKPNSLVVPRDALIAEDGKMFVRVSSGNGVQKREVKVGALTDVDALIESGVQPGETVIRGVAPGVVSAASAGAPSGK